MARLPYSRVVDVSLTRQDRFATATGFSVALIVQTEALVGILDASNRTKLYSDMTEIAVDFDSADAVNQASNTFQVSATLGGSAITTTGSQSGTHTAVSPQYGGSIAEYIESMGYDRSFVFYHTDATLYPALALLAYCATRDLDRGNLLAAQRGDINSGNAYTAKFKKLAGITVLNKGSAVVQAITGFVPGLGIDAAQGHRANTYVDIGGLPMVVEGSVGSGAFIDEIHASDWIVARMREALLSTLANNPRVPMTNPGVAILCNTVRGVMNRAVAAGIVAAEFGDDDTEIVPEFTIAVDRVENIPAAQRRNRIAPDIKVTFRYAGAIHYASASITLTF